MDPLPDLLYNNRLETYESVPIGEILGAYQRRTNQSVPIKAYLRLRVVCKEWNHTVPSQRHNFNANGNRIPEPYFVLISQNPEDAPIVTLAYDISSSMWIEKFIEVVSWFHLPGDLYMPFSVEGTDFRGLAWQLPEVYIDARLHTSSSSSGYTRRQLVRENFPEVPRLDGSALGMMVDNSTRPYSFKLIRGNCHADTLILDSRTNTWEIKRSRMVRRNELRVCPSPKICIQCNKLMFVWSDCDEIQVYSLEEDQWSTLNPPPLHASGNQTAMTSDRIWLEHWHSQYYPVADLVGGIWIIQQLPPHALQIPNQPVWSIVGARSTVQPPIKAPRNRIPLPSHAQDFRGLEHWQSEIYAVSQNEEATLSVWKLDDRATHEWSEFARIPSELFTYLLKPGTRLPIVITHYKEYFLMHALDNSDANVMKRRRRYVLFNIENKNWKILRPVRYI